MADDKPMLDELFTAGGHDPDSGVSWDGYDPAAEGVAYDDGSGIQPGAEGPASNWVPVDNAEGRWVTLEGGQHVFLQDGAVHPGGPPSNDGSEGSAGRVDDSNPLVKRLEEQADTASYPHNMTEGLNALHSYMKGLGHSDESIRLYEQLKDAWSGGGEGQAQARKDIAGALRDSTPVGKLFRDMSALEEKLYERFQAGAERRADTARKQAARDYEDMNPDEARTDRDFYRGFWKEERATKMDEAGAAALSNSMLYRKGGTGAAVESWTSRSGGANMASITQGEGGAIGADRAMSWAQAKAAGYRILGGVATYWGQQGEGEITLYHPGRIAGRTDNAWTPVDNNCGTGAGGFQPGNQCAAGMGHADGQVTKVAVTPTEETRGADQAAGRPTAPSERQVGEDGTPPKPAALPWKEPPPKEGMKGGGKKERPKGDESQTKVGDKGEGMATGLGFRSILPPGQRAHKPGEVESKGSTIDLEYDHSGRAYELKVCNTSSTEYRLKSKKVEKDAKERYAAAHDLTAHALVGVRDVKTGEIHFYASKEPGLTGAEVSPKNFDYVGSVKP